jgi:hypothetical protein
MGFEVELFRYKGVLQMKKSRFTDRQIAEVLKRVEADLTVSEPCRERGIDYVTF